MLKIISLGNNLNIDDYLYSITSIILSINNNSNEIWLFNYNEGLQHQISFNQLKLNQITKIFITEIRETNLISLLGFLATSALYKRKKKIEIYAPKEIKGYLRLFTYVCKTSLLNEIEFINIKNGLVYSNNNYKIYALQLEKNLIAYSIIEIEKPGEFNIEKAKLLGIKAGPIYGKLKMGNTIILKTGKVINGTNLCDNILEGKKITVLPSIFYSKAIVELSWKSDVIICQNFINDVNIQDTNEYKILTSIMILKLIMESKSSYLIVTNLNFYNFLITLS
uniref:hypothetical protein n=1 Tax=Galdieria phlegrea TaxID=1389228 RepID=UPI0023D86B7F|nr:hypothetical protein P2030_pgp101 [Galdieria phlegrea]WDA99838.1 hypothetical protein GAPH629S_106 [Galdieria phlegrea]